MFGRDIKLGGMPGFGRGKKGTISNGDWDRDGVKNRNDCEPLNFRKQDGGGQFMGGKDPFESRVRITKEKDSGKWIVSGKGKFLVFDSRDEAEIYVEAIS